MSYFNNLPPRSTLGRAQDWHFNLPFRNLAGRVELNVEASRPVEHHRSITLDSWRQEHRRLSQALKSSEKPKE